MEEDVFYDTVEDLEGCEDGTSQYGSVYELHRAAFYNDTKRLAVLLQEMPEDQHRQLDLHGNTALHIAAMRGHTAAVELLLAAGLPAKIRSSRGWTALDEACAARAMTAARALQQRMLADAKLDMKQKRAQLLDSMRNMPDYSLQLKWQLGSSLPGLGMLLRRYAPHDTYTIWKVGDKLRVDGSLMGIDTKSLMPEWKRGHFSLIVDGSPEGIAAAAAAAEEAMLAARKAAKHKQEQQQQQQPWHHHQQEQTPSEQQQSSAEAGSSGSSSHSNGAVSPAPAPATPPGSCCADSTAAAAAAAAAQTALEAASAATAQGSSRAVDISSSSSSSGHGSSSGGASKHPRHESSSSIGEQQQEFYDPEPAPSGPGGPRLLFVNHGKGSWVDLSADKKALKLEADTDAAELDSELIAAMTRDMEKLRLKPRNFKFAPVKGWLGGDQTEKVEGWKCTVYEAAGKLLAVSTSKARLHLSPTASFEEYLAAEYAADAVSETLIDPLTPSGIDLMSSSSKKDRSGKSGSMYGADTSMHSSSGASMGADAAFEADGMVWGDAASSSGYKTKKELPKLRSKGSTKAGSSSSSTGDAAAGGAEAAAGGRVLRARCWMARDFPMSLAQLLPLLDVIGNANKHMAKVGKFLSKYSQLEMFPVKLQVPLLLTVHALVSFKAFHLLQRGTGHPPPPADFFAVPNGFKRKLLQEVMDKASKNAFGGVGGDLPPDWDLEPGASPFYGGDEGAEYL